MEGKSRGDLIRCSFLSERRNNKAFQLGDVARNDIKCSVDTMDVTLL